MSQAPQLGEPIISSEDHKEEQLDQQDKQSQIIDNNQTIEQEEAPVEKVNIIKSKKIRCYDCLIDSKWIILIVLIALFLGLAYPASKYEGATDMYFEPPKSSDSYKALQYVNASFSNLTLTSPYVIFINDKNKVFKNESASTLNNTLCHTNVSGFNDIMRNFTTTLFTNLNTSKYGQYLVASYDGFASVDSYPLAQSIFCKEDSMLIEYIFNSSQFKSQTSDSNNINNIIEDTKKQIIPNDDTWKQLDVSLISMDYLIKQLIDSIVQDVMKLDTISITFGLIVLMLVLQVPQLLIISLINLLSTLIIQFGFSYLVTLCTNVASFNTAIQSACVVAFTFDYSLFLFSRVKQSSAEGKDARQVIRDMIQYSGKIILTSAGCFCLVLLVFLFSPVKIVQTIGIVCAITMICIAPISILNTVAMLAAAPQFFLNQQYDFWKDDYLNPKNWKCMKKDSLDNPEVSQDGQQKKCKCDNQCKCTPWYDSHCTMKVNQELKQSKLSKIFEKYEDFIISKPYITIIAICVVLVISLGFAGQFLKIKYALDLKQLLPRDSKTIKQIDQFDEQYGGGMLFPYYVIFEKDECINESDPSKDNTDCLINRDAWTLMQEMAQYFINQSKVNFTDDKTYLQLNNTQFIAPFMAGGAPIPYATFTIDRLLPTYQVILNQTAPNVNNLNIFAMGIYSGVDITEVGALEFTPWYRDVIEEYRPKFEQLGIKINEYSYSNAMVDTVNAMFGSLWYIILLDLICVGVILFFVFQSWLAPLRLIISLVLINIFFFGVAQLIFQEGKNEDMMWPVFIANIAFSIALGCDYEIFSFEGIHEAYYEELDQGKEIDKETYKKIIHKGSNNILVVLTAGFIMIISFTGLLCSSLDLLLEVGTCLIMDLIYDCFILIPVLVPGSAYLVGQKSTMWPGYKLHQKQVLEQVAKRKQYVQKGVRINDEGFEQLIE